MEAVIKEVIEKIKKKEREARIEAERLRKTDLIKATEWDGKSQGFMEARWIIMDYRMRP